MSAARVPLPPTTITGRTSARAPLRPPTTGQTPLPEESAAELLRQLMPLWDGDQAQVNQLLALRYTNGTSIIDVERRDILTEVVGMLRTEGFEATKSYLEHLASPEALIWNQRAMDIGRIKVEREITVSEAKEEGIKGVGKCRRCQSNELAYSTQQLRGGDEAATIFARCVLCGAKWRE